ncbi:unnamed protein product, partial [Rotaria socialis]
LAATNDVIKALTKVIANKNNVAVVRSTACEALGRMGEKAGTNEVIEELTKAIRADTDAKVKGKACEALGRIGEKAGKKEPIIEALIRVMNCNDDDLGYDLDDDEENYADVRNNALEALLRIGELAATNDVIKALTKVIANKNNVAVVRSTACEALGRMGEKAATNEVIEALTKAIEDEIVDVRSNALNALAEIGEKAATNEVIEALIKVIVDKDADAVVRSCACVTLERMGEKAKTRDGIEALSKTIGSRDNQVSSLACYTLGQMGEKAATEEVIEALTKAIRERDFLVKICACGALGEMGEKARTKEVIEALWKAIGNWKDDESEKAVTERVIKVLRENVEDDADYVDCVDDGDDSDDSDDIIYTGALRRSASEALSLLLYNASVMECLHMSITLDSEYSDNCGSAFEWLLVQPSFRKLHERVVRNVTWRLMGVSDLALDMVPVKELAPCIVDQSGSDWSILVAYVCIINCVAVMESGDGIEFVSGKGHETAEATNGRLRVKFVKELVEWKKKQGLLPQEDFAGSSVCVVL